MRAVATMFYIFYESFSLNLLQSLVPDELIYISTGFWRMLLGSVRFLQGFKSINKHSRLPLRYSRLSKTKGETYTAIKASLVT